MPGVDCSPVQTEARRSARHRCPPGTGMFWWVSLGRKADLHLGKFTEQSK